jgi:hypothetical protein
MHRRLWLKHACLGVSDVWETGGAPVHRRQCSAVQRSAVQCSAVHRSAVQDLLD